MLLQPRFFVALGLFTLSLLVIVPAPNVFVWRFVILATEFGHWLCLLPILLLIWEVAAKGKTFNLITFGLGLLAAIIFLLPLFEACFLAQRLPAQLAAAYGRSHLPDDFPSSPLNFGALWEIHRDPPVIEKDVVVKTGDGSTIPVIIYQSAEAKVRPCILFVHGGGWNSGEANQLPGLSRWLASQGYLVASVGYRLAPKFQWPAQKEDVAAAFTYLKSNAAALGINPNQFVVIGRSAGGQIALATAYEQHDPAIRGCVDLYAPTDMNFAYKFGKEDDLLKSRSLVRDFMGGTPETRPAAYVEASALDQVGPDTPPTLIVQGTRDELVWIRHSQRLTAKLQQAGRPVCFLEMPWATHAFDYNLYGPGGQLMRYALSWFLHQVLN